MAQRKLRILCFGDSLTTGWLDYGAVLHPYKKQLVRELEAAFPGSEIEATVDGLPGGLTAHFPESPSEALQVSTLVSPSRNPSTEYRVAAGLLTRGITQSPAAASRTTGPSSSAEQSTYSSTRKTQSAHLLTTARPLPACSDIGTGWTGEQAFENLAETWNVALSRRSKVLALTVPECHVSTPRLRQLLADKREAVNSQIRTFKRPNL